MKNPFSHIGWVLFPEVFEEKKKKSKSTKSGRNKTK